MTFNPATFIIFRAIASLAGLALPLAQALRRVLLKVVSRGNTTYSQASRFFDIRELDQ